MKQYIFTTEITKQELENYKYAMADYLESLYQLNDIDEISEAQLVENYKNDVYNGAAEFDRSFHYHTNKTMLVCREKEDGYLVLDVEKKDIHNAIDRCRGAKQEFYIEDGDFRFNGSSCGELVVRFAKNDYIFQSGDFIGKEDIDTFTDPVGDWLNERMNFWNKEMEK